MTDTCTDIAVCNESTKQIVIGYDLHINSNRPDLRSTNT